MRLSTVVHAAVQAYFTGYGPASCILALFFPDLGLLIKPMLVLIDKQISQNDKQAYLPDLWNSNCCDDLKKKLGNGSSEAPSVYQGGLFCTRPSFYLPRNSLYSFLNLDVGPHFMAFLLN